VTEKKTWIGAGVGVVAIGAIALVGVKLVGGSSTPRTVASGPPDTSSAAQDGAAVGRDGQGGGPNGRGRRSGGTIASIDGSTLTLTTPDGQTRVVTSSSTTFASTSSGSLSDVKIGDNVVIQGTTTDTTIVADRITDSGTVGGRFGGGGGSGGGAPSTGQTTPGQGGQGGPRARPVVGTISAVNETSTTVKVADGTTYTMTTTASTTVSLVKASSLAALHVGQTVRVNGPTAADGTITATSVREGANPAGPPGP